MSDTAPVIYLLAGVTAAGKSVLSLDFAKAVGGEILSCDSIAVYRGMDIGSAKPSHGDRQKVVHHGIDLVDVNKIFSVAEYSMYAKNVIERSLNKNVPIVVTGGSGFYLQSFLSPVVDEIEVSEEIRNRVGQINAERGLDGMLKILQEFNPDGLGGIDVLNPRRVMRGLERCLASGKTILQLKKEFEGQGNPYVNFEKRVIWLDRENEDIEGRISRRTKIMLEDGLLEETKKLLSLGIETNSSASNAVGYRECIACLKGKITSDELLAAINHSTRKLVSKQRKWFRKHFGSEARFMMNQGLEMSEAIKWNWIRHS